jgi:hypothetical protein
MAKTYGYNTVMRIVTDTGDFPYRIATGRVQYRSDTHDVTDTEFPGGGPDGSAPRRDRGIGLGEAEITVTAFLDPTVAMHVAPLNIRIQSRIKQISIWPGGVDFDPDILTDCLVDDVTKDPIGDPQQPNRVSFHAFCGNFQEPGVTPP